MSASIRGDHRDLTIIGDKPHERPMILAISPPMAGV
jgi:hypothetical protein